MTRVVVAAVANKAIISKTRPIAKRAVLLLLLLHLLNMKKQL
jgi:hypothetical protein